MYLAGPRALKAISSVSSGFRTFAPLVQWSPVTTAPTHPFAGDNHCTPCRRRALKHATYLGASRRLASVLVAFASPRPVVALLHLRRRRALECPSPPLLHRPSAPFLAQLFHRAADQTRSALTHAPLPPLTNAALPLICSKPQPRRTPPRHCNQFELHSQVLSNSSCARHLHSPTKLL